MRAFLLLLLLLLVVRGLTVLALGDVFFYGEELEKGAAAKAMLDGLGVDHHRLAYHYYEGGGFVVSHLKALAFLLVGENVLAHKFVGLFTCALVFAAGYRLVVRHFGATTAVLFGLLFIFCQESFQKLSLLSLGIHFEACALLYVVLDQMLRLLNAEERYGHERAAMLLGLAGGFGIYFNYQLAPAVLYAAVLILLLRLRVLSGMTLVSGLGAFVLGLSPLLVMYGLVGSEVLDIHGAGPTGGAFVGVVKLGAFARSVLANRDWSEISCAVLFACFAAYAVTARLEAGLGRRRWAMVLLGYGLVWCVVYVSTGFVVGRVYHDFLYMRLAPLWAVGLVLGATGLRTAAGSVGLARAAGRGGIVLALAVGVHGTWQILAEATPGDWRKNVTVLRTAKGFDYGGYYAKLARHLNGDTARRLAVALRFHEDERALLRADLAVEAFSENVDVGYGDALRIITRIDPDTIDDWALGFGPMVVRRGGPDLLAALQHTQGPPSSFLVGMNPRALLAEALGRFGVSRFQSPEILSAEIAAVEGRPGAEAFWRGAGYRALRSLALKPYGSVRFVLKPDRVRVFLGQQVPAAVPHLLDGFDRGLVLHGLAQ